MGADTEQQEYGLQDLSVIAFTVLAFGMIGLAKRLFVLVTVLGVLVSIFPGAASAADVIVWGWPEALAGWAGQNYLPLSVLVLLYLAWRARAGIVDIQQTQHTHDLILAGLMNYFDGVPRPDEQDEQERKGTRRFVADSMRLFWNYWTNHAWIPFWGARVSDLYRYKVYNTVLVRHGQKVTLDEDLHSKIASKSGAGE